MSIKKHLREHFFSYIIFLLIVVIGFFSYYRFMIKHDYIVGYQGVCDPSTGKCFMSCEDDACTKPDYYDNVLKYAPDLYKECGTDITNCEDANVCLAGDHKCSITYCDRKNKDDICEPELQNNINNSNI